MTDPEKKEARSRTRNLVKVLTRDQILLLKESTEKSGIGLLFLIALRTGLQQGELLSLCWQDLDMETRVLSIQRTMTLFPKSGFLEREIQPPRQRVIKLPASLMLHLQHHQEAHMKDASRLVRCGKKSTPSFPTREEIISRLFASGVIFSKHWKRRTFLPPHFMLCAIRPSPCCSCWE